VHIRLEALWEHHRAVGLLPVLEKSEDDSGHSNGRRVERVGEPNLVGGWVGGWVRKGVGEWVSG
jgi:hypothetical protein